MSPQCQTAISILLIALASSMWYLTLLLALQTHWESVSERKNTLQLGAKRVPQHKVNKWKKEITFRNGYAPKSKVEVGALPSATWSWTRGKVQYIPKKSIYIQ